MDREQIDLCGQMMTEIFIKAIALRDENKTLMISKNIYLIPFLIPKSVRKIILGHKYNKPLVYNGQRLIPDWITEINFGLLYDKPLIIDNISVFPDSIEIIKFPKYSRFKQPLLINNICAIPNSVHTIDVSQYFEDYDAKLPMSIRNITFDLHWDNIMLPCYVEQVCIKRGSSQGTYYPDTPEFNNLFTLYYPPIKSAIE